MYLFKRSILMREDALIHLSSFNIHKIHKKRQCVFILFVKLKLNKLKHN